MIEPSPETLMTRASGKRELRANSRGQAESHGAQAAAAEMLRGVFEMKMLRHPHLVLADVAGNDAIFTGAIGKSFQETRRVNFRAGRGVIPGVSFFRGGALAAPRLDIERARQRSQATGAGCRSAERPRDAACRLPRGPHPGESLWRCGANAFRRPVARSSNRAPTQISRSQVCTA